MGRIAAFGRDYDAILHQYRNRRGGEPVTRLIQTAGEDRWWKLPGRRVGGIAEGRHFDDGQPRRWRVGGRGGQGVGGRRSEMRRLPQIARYLATASGAVVANRLVRALVRHRGWRTVSINHLVHAFLHERGELVAGLLPTRDGKFANINRSSLIIYRMTGYE